MSGGSVHKHSEDTLKYQQWIHNRLTIILFWHREQFTYIHLFPAFNISMEILSPWYMEFKCREQVCRHTGLNYQFINKHFTIMWTFFCTFEAVDCQCWVTSKNYVYVMYTSCIRCLWLSHQCTIAAIIIIKDIMCCYQPWKYHSSSECYQAWAFYRDIKGFTVYYWCPILYHVIRYYTASIIRYAYA